MHGPTGALERQMLDRREAFLAFIRSKVDDDELAEDILQESLLRALQSASRLDDDEKLVPWLYRIIRNAITDAYRRRAAASRRIEQFALDQPTEEPSPGEVAVLCACFRSVLPTMKPEYAELIEAMDLASAGPEEMAARLGVTRNNLKVRHHRARQQLRQRLEETCRSCAKHGCIDCSCGRSAG